MAISGCLQLGERSGGTGARVGSNSVKHCSSFRVASSDSLWFSLDCVDIYRATGGRTKKARWWRSKGTTIGVSHIAKSDDWEERVSPKPSKVEAHFSDSAMMAMCRGLRRWTRERSDTHENHELGLTGSHTVEGSVNWADMVIACGSYVAATITHGCLQRLTASTRSDECSSNYDDVDLNGVCVKAAYGSESWAFRYAKLWGWAYRSCWVSLARCTSWRRYWFRCSGPESRKSSRLLLSVGFFFSLFFFFFSFFFFLKLNPFFFISDLHIWSYFLDPKFQSLCHWFPYFPDLIFLYI